MAEEKNCSDVLFYIKKQHIFFLSVLSVAFVIGSFVAGFTLARYFNVNEFVIEATKVSFADEFNHSLRLMGLATDDSDDDSDNESNNNGSKETDSESPTDNKIHEELNIKESISKKDEVENSLSGWQAALFGGAQKGCSVFIEKVRKEFGILCQLKERKGRTGSGKQTNWFQVMTPIYQKKGALEEFLALLEKGYRIKNPVILYCRPNSPTDVIGTP